MPRLSMKKMNKKVAAKKSVRRSKTAKGGKRGKSKRTINKRKTTKQKGGNNQRKCPKCNREITYYLPASSVYEETYCDNEEGQKCPHCGEEWCL